MPKDLRIGAPANSIPRRTRSAARLESIGRPRCLPIAPANWPRRRPAATGIRLERYKRNSLTNRADITARSICDAHHQNEVPTIPVAGVLGVAADRAEIAVARRGQPNALRRA